MLKKYFRPSSEFIPNAEIFSFLNSMKVNATPQVMGRLMSASGFTKGKINNKRGFFVEFTGCNEIIKRSNDIKPTKIRMHQKDYEIKNLRQKYSIEDFLRRKLKDVDSYYINKVTDCHPYDIIQWKKGRYEMTEKQIELLLKAYD